MGRLLRFSIVFLAIVLSNWFAQSLTGYSLIGGDLFLILFLSFVAIFAFTCIWRM
jgi:hypothetical protein